MNKRSLFFAALVLLVAALICRSTNAARANYLVKQMVAADKAGKSTSALNQELADYVKFHMGSSVKWTLEGSFDRADAAVKASAKASAAAQAANAHVYTQAQQVCSGKTDSITQARCNAAYLESHLTVTPTPVPASKQSDYQHRLTAPAWTPDLAGALFLGAAAAFLFALLMSFGKKRHALR